MKTIKKELIESLSYSMCGFVKSERIQRDHDYVLYVRYKESYPEKIKGKIRYKDGTYSILFRPSRNGTIEKFSIFYVNNYGQEIASEINGDIYVNKNLTELILNVPMDQRV